MRITLNLATRPFVELRPVYTRLRIAMVVLAVLATVMGFAWRAVEVRARSAEAKMGALEARTQKFQQERSSNETRMRQPENASVLARSQFLNALFVRKGFSWTAVMMDLENVLPAGVQVTSIEPVITPEHEVLIRLRVGGERDRVVQMVRNLEVSKRFVSPRLSSESLQNQSTGGGSGAQPASFQQGSPTAVEFDIVSDYKPLPERKEAASSTGAGKSGTGTGKTGTGTGKKGTGTGKKGIAAGDQGAGNKGAGSKGKKAGTGAGTTPKRSAAGAPAGPVSKAGAGAQPIQNEAILAAERARAAAQVKNATRTPGTGGVR